MFENITYDKTTGKFFNKNGKEVGWKNSKGYVFITVENLREVTRLENMHNLAFHREGNYPCIKKRYNKFAVCIRGKYLGLYNTPEEAKTVVDNYSK